MARGQQKIQSQQKAAEKTAKNKKVNKSHVFLLELSNFVIW